jgi:hypothetical protein
MRFVFGPIPPSRVLNPQEEGWTQAGPLCGHSFAAHDRRVLAEPCRLLRDLRLANAAESRPRNVGRPVPRVQHSSSACAYLGCKEQHGVWSLPSPCCTQACAGET